jgi:hypothetical protein
MPGVLQLGIQLLLLDVGADLVDGLGPGHLVPRFWMISCITRPFSIWIL